MEDKYDLLRFLPTTAKEMKLHGWEQPDVIFFSGDAYVDHPSFGIPLLGRVLQHKGYKVAIVPQPNWRDDLRDFKKLGRPRLFFGVGSGCMDSMVNHYTANKRLRSDDAYSPDGKAGYRPDYAVTVYTKILKKLYPDVPVVIGGIEASLRRFTHYDYWQDKLLPSVLFESGADLLVWGMGEKQILEIAERLNKGESVNTFKDIPQTAYLASKEDTIITSNKIVYMSSYETCIRNKEAFAKNFVEQEVASNQMFAPVLIEPIGKSQIVANPAYPPDKDGSIDSYYDLPFTRLPHPKYKGKTIPAYDMIKFSINIHRGCYGGCSFCTISAHQGKFIVSRSESSILKEVDKVLSMPDFKGYISDIGAPSANMYGLRGKNEDICKSCKKPSCLFPSPCKNMNKSHKRLLTLYRSIRAKQGLIKAFVGSGIRYDLFLDSHGNFNSPVEKEWFTELMRYHVSGRLKVAPEHTQDHVLQLMRKPSFSLFDSLYRHFEKINNEYGLREQLIPYFISSHPGCRMMDMDALSKTTRKYHLRLEQVQDFTPTPMTLSSVIFYSGINPYTGEKVFTAHKKEDKLAQKQYFFKK